MSFAVETTLAGSRVNLADEAKQHGFAVHLLYVGINSPERSILRVRDRVAKGGHFVPEEDVRRRYLRSMENARDLFLRVDRATVFDNSGAEHRIVLIANCGVITYRADPLPPWLASWPNLK
jgi:predicted ABC-type ATPase